MKEDFAEDVVHVHTHVVLRVGLSLRVTWS